MEGLYPLFQEMPLGDNHEIHAIRACCGNDPAAGRCVACRGPEVHAKERHEVDADALYTSPVGVNDWEDDVFGKDVLEPGESIDITIADGRSVCKYDMRFEFSEDSNLDTTEDTQDLCELGAYTIHE